MKNLFFLCIVIGLMLIDCTKTDNDALTTKKVGAIEGSFTAQYNDISIAKSYSPPVINWSALTLLRKDGSMVDGSELITGSVAWNWWHTGSGRNGIGQPANQLSFPGWLLPDEDLRVVYSVQNGNADYIYYGSVDFNPGTVQFPLTVKAYRLGDYLSIDATQLLSLPGYSNLHISVSYSLVPLDYEATKHKPWTPTIPFGFDDLQYGNVNGTTSTPITTPGEVVLYSGFTQKVKGNVVITVQCDDISITKIVPASEVGKGMALKLTTTKVGWYDSATATFNDNDIQVNTQEIWIDGQNNQGGNNNQPPNNSPLAPMVNFSANKTNINPGETVIFTDHSQNSPTSWSWDFGDEGKSTDQNPSHTYTNPGRYSVTLIATNNFGSNSSIQTGYINVNPAIVLNIILTNASPYQVYNGPANDEQVQLGIFLTIDPTNHAFMYTTGGVPGYSGEVLDEGAVNLIANNTLQGPPDFASASFYMALVQGHSYIIRYRKVTNYQTVPLPTPPASDYNYGIFYVNSQQPDGFTITYQGPFTGSNN